MGVEAYDVFPFLPALPDIANFVSVVMREENQPEWPQSFIVHREIRKIHANVYIDQSYNNYCVHCMKQLAATSGYITSVSQCLLHLPKGPQLVFTIIAGIDHNLH